MRLTALVFLAFLLAAVFVFSQGTIHQQNVLGNIGQITALIFATWNCFKLAGTYSSEDPPRKAWLTMSFGSAIWLIAQILAMYHELFLESGAHGTIADVFWIIGYILFLRAMILFVKNFKSTGLPLGNSWSYVIQAAIFAAIFAILFQTLLLPLIKTPERSFFLNFLDIGYPVLDFLLISLCSVLIRFSWILRGSGISRSWILLCIGFCIVAGADIALGYSSDATSFVYRFLDLVYFSAYFFIALSAANQWSVQKKLLIEPA
jgi:hypothetical protein